MKLLPLRYEQIIYLHGKQAKSALKLFNLDGENAALNYLKRWHIPGTLETVRKISGTTDNHYHHGNYVMYYSMLIGYIGRE